MIKLICCDCNGVLENVNHDYSKNGYYVLEDTKNIHNKIFKYLFKSRYLLRSWMINEITYKELNKIMADKFNLDAQYLNDILVQSVKNLEWNWDLINLLQKYREENIKIIMTTDNMDIFSDVAVPHHNLNKYFDEISNSADIKLLKDENNLQVFNDISNKYKLSLNEILIIDDNIRTIDKAKEIGFKTYLYNIETCKNFEKWFIDNK